MFSGRCSLLKRWLVWLSRIHLCWGFGIQSPKDYAFVRYVINEHWPYYAYDKLSSDSWLTRKFGRLYLRLANWRQPTWMPDDEYRQWWQAGCQKTRFVVPEDAWDGEESQTILEMARVDITDDKERWMNRCNADSIIVVEGINNDWLRWHDLEQDDRVGTTFDLYYCGVLLFDKNRYNHHYKVNF